MKKEKKAPTMNIVQIFTVSQSLCFLQGQIEFWRQKGYKVHIICADGELLRQAQQKYGVEIYTLPFSRSPRRWHVDLFCFFKLLLYLLKLQPTVVHTNTPKASFLGLLASFITRVPIRIYEMHGLPLETAEGNMKLFLRYAEKLMCSIATQVIAVSDSLKEVAIQEGLVKVNKISVINNGSCNGIDSISKFNPENTDIDKVLSIRMRYKISDNQMVVGFVGRFCYDKGIRELYYAWQLVKIQQPTAKLLLIGQEDERQKLSDEWKQKLEADESIIIIEEVANIEDYYAVMNFLVLPSHREGLGNVVLEAAAMGKPAVLTHITGLKNTAIPNVTGLYCPRYSVHYLAQHMLYYIENPSIAQLHGANARRFVMKQFEQEKIWNKKLELYKRLIAEAKLVPLPYVSPLLQTSD